MAGKTQTADQRNMRAALLTLVPFGGGRLVALTLCGAIVCKPSVVVPVFRPGAVRRVITPIAPVIPIIFPSFVKGGIRVSLAFAFALFFPYPWNFHVWICRPFQSPTGQVLLCPLSPWQLRGSPKKIELEAGGLTQNHWHPLVTNPKTWCHTGTLTTPENLLKWRCPYS